MRSDNFKKFNNMGAEREWSMTKHKQMVKLSSQHDKNV